MNTLSLRTQLRERLNLKDRATLLSILFLLLALCSITWDIWQMSKMWLNATDIVAVSHAFPREGDLRRIDYMPTMSELARHKTFLSTFEWWHRSFAGNVPFWRPLTSQVWWLEMRFFGFDRLDKYQWVTICLHLIDLTLLSLLIKRLTGRWSLAVLTCVIFAGTRDGWPRTFFGYSLGIPPANVAIGEWNNQQDIWASIGILGCLVCVYDRNWISALICAFVGVCFKETGWLAFPLALIMLVALHRLKEVPMWVYGATLVTVAVMIGLRASAGRAVMRGYETGTNVGWFDRYTHAVGGPLVNALLTVWAPIVLLAAAILGLILWQRGKFLLRFVLGLLTIALTGVLLGYTMRSNWLEGLEILFDVSEPSRNIFVTSFIWLLLAYWVLLDKQWCRLTLSLVLMTWLSALALVAASQVKIHVMYTAYQFNSAVDALILAVAIKAIRSQLLLKKPRKAISSFDS